MFDLIPFDLETTGIDCFTDVPVSYYLGDKEGYINPGIDIPESTTEIHGITNEMVADAPNLLNSVFMIRDALDTYWAQNKIIVGMNVSYDITMINSCLHRYGSFLVPGAVIDVLAIDRFYDKYRKGSRKLVDLCAHYGIELENAHTASADAKACPLIFNKQLEKYESLKRLDLRNNKTMRMMYQQWLTNYSVYLVKNGGEPIPVGRYEWPIHSKEI